MHDVETGALAGGGDDRALPFQVEGLDVRGRVVTLGPSIDTILQRHDFPPPVKRLVGEAAVLASLLATSLKDVGRFILQTQTDGPVSMIVVDVRTPGQIRATASFDADSGRARSPRMAAPIPPRFSATARSP